MEKLDKTTENIKLGDIESQLFNAGIDISTWAQDQPKQLNIYIMK